MSVLKDKRTVSKADFINVAHQIFVETMAFLTRLSARYSRLLAEPTAKLAGEVLDEAEKANSIYPSDEQHLLEARASLMAPDVRLALCYEVIMQNPQGAFTNSAGQNVPPGKAEDKLEKMSQSLGELIDRENDLIKGALESLGRKKKA